MLNTIKIKILEHMIKESKRLYPHFIFHQYSALSHSAKLTIKWLKDKKKILPPEKWLSSFPDCAF